MASPAGSASTALILASASPRRRWLLAALGVAFSVLAVDIDERPREGEAPSVFAQRMAAEKARAEAFDLMVAHAQSAGANAVVCMRYDANEITDGITEVLAYGTAVVVEPALP